MVCHIKSLELATHLHMFLKFHTLFDMKCDALYLFGPRAISHY